MGSGGDSRPRVTGGTGPGSRPLPPPLPLPRNFQSSRVTGKRNTGRRVAEREPRLRNHFLEQRMTGPITTDPYLISAAGPAGPAWRTRALHPPWRCARRERAGAWNNGPLLSSPVNRHRFPPALSSPRSGARTGPSARGAEGLAASRAAPRHLSPTRGPRAGCPCASPGRPGAGCQPGAARGGWATGLCPPSNLSSRRHQHRCPGHTCREGQDASPAPPSGHLASHCAHLGGRVPGVPSGRELHAGASSAGLEGQKVGSQPANCV